MNRYLTQLLSRLAGRLIRKASFENQSLSSGVVRKILQTHPLTRMLLLFQAGKISDVKSIIVNKGYSSETFLRISRFIDSVDLAKTDWRLFKEEVGIPFCLAPYKPFNDQVLMLVNYCAIFDQNGYAVRNTQIKNILDEMSVQTNFCARLGYPWDLPGRSGWPKDDRVISEEGMVWLKHDANAFVGRVDAEHWKAYAEHIKGVVHQLSVKPTVLHAHSKYSNGIAAVIAGRQLGIPVVYEMRGLWHLTRAQRAPSFSDSDLFEYEERLEVWAAELADSVVVISYTLKTWLIRHGIPDNKIVVIPNAPDNSALDLSNIPRGRSDVCKLAFMGALVSYEGIDTVIEAVSLLVAQGFKISFDVFGEGLHRATLEKRVKQLNLCDQIRFHGHVSKARILKQIANFDIFPVVRVDSEVTRVIPPMKHLAPMAAGKVVLVSALPALLDNVPECVALHAVPPEDSYILAKKIQFLWDSPEELADIGDMSREWVKQNRSWVENGQIYKELYESVASMKKVANISVGTK